MHNRKFIAVIILTVAACGIIAGCAAVKPPIYVDPDIDKIDISSVTLLPIIDRRVDKSKELDYERYVGNRIRNKMKSFGYEVVRPEAYSDTSKIPVEAVAEMETHELALLATNNDKYILLVYLDDAVGKTGLGYSFKIELTSVLLDRDNKSVLWKSKALGSKGQGGLMGCMMSGDTQAMAIKQAINSMYSSFPKAMSKRK
jgi:hypothetical protein